MKHFLFISSFTWETYFNSHTLSSPTVIYGLEQNRYPGRNPTGLVFFSCFFFVFRTVTLDRRVAEGMRKGITGSAENSETVEAGDWKTSMDERGF